MTFKPKSKTNSYMIAKHNNHIEQIYLTSYLSKQFRRQLRKYPCGINITIQSANADAIVTHNSKEIPFTPNPINNIDNSLSHLQNNRYISSLNCQGVQQTQRKPLPLMMDYNRKYSYKCKCKYFHWYLVFVASVLAFCGLITYAIWLHNISVIRERRLQIWKAFNNTTVDIEYNTSHPDINNPFAQTSGEDAFNTQQNIQSSLIDGEKIFTANDDSQIDFEMNNGRAMHIKPTVLPPDVSSSKNTSSQHPRKYNDYIYLLMNGYNTQLDRTVKVSPTIPTKPFVNTTPAMSSMKSTSSPDHVCYSTSLDMCRGVNDYDLTHHPIQISERDVKIYDGLYQSNCSVRSIEFVCAVLEPECRPKHFGILKPCQRICKAIQKACSVIIERSYTLTNIFDCNQYPDTNDANRCEDFTKRKDYCYHNEFRCSDRSCIPKQWQCDNIKDCPQGEDEDNCLICDQPNAEFRCHSNEKCISEQALCDLNYDCLDGSDEMDCNQISIENDNEENDNQTVNYIINKLQQIDSYSNPIQYTQYNDDNNNNTTDFSTATSDNFSDLYQTYNKSKRIPSKYDKHDKDERFYNFRDSKEIMITSDSENRFKYFALSNNQSDNQSDSWIKAKFNSKQFKSTSPPCLQNQLRCVSGECIAVTQLCDKKVDCADGLDEYMCVYKDRINSVPESTT